MQIYTKYILQKRNFYIDFIVGKKTLQILDKIDPQNVNLLFDSNINVNEVTEDEYNDLISSIDQVLSQKYDKDLVLKKIQEITGFILRLSKKNPSDSRINELKQKIYLLKNYSVVNNKVYNFLKVVCNQRAINEYVARLYVDKIFKIKNFKLYPYLYNGLLGLKQDLSYTPKIEITPVPIY